MKSKGKTLISLNGKRLEKKSIFSSKKTQHGRTLISLNGKRLEKKPIFSLKREQPGQRLALGFQKNFFNMLTSLSAKKVLSSVLAVSLFSGISSADANNSIAPDLEEEIKIQTDTVEFMFEEPSKQFNILLDSKPILENIKYKEQSSIQTELYDFSSNNNVETLAESTPLLISSSEPLMMFSTFTKEEEKPTKLEAERNTDLSVEELVPLTEEQTQQIMREEILEYYNLTDEQLDIICAIVLAEAWANSYEDAYAVINTMFNRTRSYAWHYSADKVYGEGAGFNLYYQAILEGQFVVFENGTYKKFLGVHDVPGYQAVLDFLTTQEPMHDYLNFCSNQGNPNGKESFAAYGNLYYNHLKEEDIIPLEKKLTL